MKSELANFNSLPLKVAARELLRKLGYKSEKFLVGAGSTPQDFLDDFVGGRSFNQAKALFAEWKSADLLFQLTDQELCGQSSIFTDDSVQRGLLKSYVFIAIELKDKEYARGKLSAITRQINQLFPMPVMVIFKHGELLTIAVINRRRSKNDPDRDVLERATLIRDIAYSNPHRGHLDILASLALAELKHPQKKPIADFDTLHAAWEQIFNVELLNERFYRELANWYFWALPQVEFPPDLEPDSEKRRATGLIRLLTRLLFCWFLKEKGLIPEKLFNPTDLSNILKDFDPESETRSVFYQAILQNLFFATLNQRMGRDSKGKPYRFFATDEGFRNNRTTYDVNNLFRYEALFQEEPDTALTHFADIPFLNGGLFECLDRSEDITQKKLYLDGFSRNPKKRPSMPDRLFFDSGETADLSTAYGDSKRKAERVTGLINILSRYKFTIDENTPIDQEIALDPELLGKVFENLLASYNEETKTSARKQTGSFYTPRPIVDFMVDESLKAHLLRHLVQVADMSKADARSRLDLLFSYTEKPHAFNPNEVAILIDAIDKVKILDPACGSGAFPMGALHKLVYVLGKLDPENSRWKQTQLDKLDSAPMREELERAFNDNNDDYGRKLYLIENCLFGVDIQPIAIQITKLRFFISLVCDQRTNRDKTKNHGIRPLPNLETKFVAANSLVGLPSLSQPLIVDPRINVIESEIEAKYHSHFSIQRRDQKLALQRKIKSLRLELARLLADSFIATDKAKLIADWDPFNPQLSAAFFDPHWMFGRTLIPGFDIIIGNPPYFKENNDKHRFDGLRNLPCYQGKMDVWYLFVDVCLDLLKASGILSFIATNNWVTNSGASNLRSKILHEARIISLIDFQDYMVFQSASVQTMVMFLSKEVPPSRYYASISKAKSSFSRDDIAILQSGSQGESPNLKTFEVEIVKSDLLGQPLLLNSADKSSILDIIDGRRRLRLLDHEIAQGIVPNPDRINSRNIKTLGEQNAIHRGIQIGDGVFVLNNVERMRISLSEHKYLKPLYEPIHIERYAKRPSDLVMIYSKKGSFNPEDAPSIVSHLHKYKEIMEERRENKTGRIQFYNLHWPRDESFFKSGEKLLVPRKSSRPIFFHTEDPAYVMLSLNVVKTSRVNMRFLSGVLNSSVVRYWLRYRGSMQGLNYQIDSAPLLRVPIPMESDSRQGLIGAIVSLIQIAHAAEGSLLNGAWPFLEDLVDACVMECYFREHMAERDLLFCETVAPYLIAYDPAASEPEQCRFLSNLHNTLNSPTHSIRSRLLRLSVDSPDLLAIIKKEGCL